MLSRHRKILGHSSKELHHLSQVVIVLVVILTLSWLKEEVTSHHLEDCAGKAPDICWSVIVGSNYNFWRTILSSLNFRRKMVVRPASIAHVTDLDLHIIADSWASLEFLLFFCILSIFSFFVGFLLFSEETVELLFLFFTISCLASRICNLRLFLVFYLRILFRLCTTNCNIIDVNFFQVWCFFFLTIAIARNFRLLWDIRFGCILTLLHLFPFPVQFLLQIFLLLWSQALEWNILVAERSCWLLLGFLFDRQSSSNLHV